jgi:uncharacterized membrane protein
MIVALIFALALEVAVIVTVPETFPETTPLALTVATEVFELFQVTFLSVLAGAGAAWSAMVLPLLTILPGADIVRELGAGILLTVTLMFVTTDVAYPERALIVAVPALLAVIRPFELTDATDVLLDVHLICCDDVAGTAWALICVVPPM